MSAVLVINPPNSPFTHNDLLIEPIDVLTVATFIQAQGHNVKFLDMDVSHMVPASIVEILHQFRPDYVVIPFDYHIPLFTTAAISGIRQLLSHCCEYGSLVVLGGRPASAYPEEFLIDPKIVIATQEMEPALLLLLTTQNWNSNFLLKQKGIIFLDDNKVVRTEAPNARFNLDQLPIPDRSLANLSQYIDVRSILSSRGCVERCGFCPVHEFWGKWRSRNASSVVEEIAMLEQCHGAKKVLFLDDHAMVNKRRLNEISEALINLDSKVCLGCLGTVSSYDNDTVQHMYRAGFRWIHYGTEFADQTVLDTLQKRITVEQIRRAILGTKEAGLRVRTSWILDAPMATEAGLRSTIDLILETEPHEIRAHFLSLRAYAPFSREVSPGSGIPQQYIHADAPHSSFNTLPAEIIERELIGLTTELSKRGYHIIRSSDDYRSLLQVQGSHRDLKFISFCPGRYGIGWEW